jgi:hypothetical protein
VIHCLKFLVVIAAVTFDVWGGLNISGFCFSEMRYVPDKEFFARYLESAAYVHPHLYQVRNLTNEPGVRSFTDYRDGNDFLIKNPDCCSYGPQQGVNPDSNLSGPSFLQRFFGLVWGSVAVHNQLHYVDSAGNPKVHVSFFQHWVSPCGYFVKSY